VPSLEAQTRPRTLARAADIIYDLFLLFKTKVRPNNSNRRAFMRRETQKKLANGWEGSRRLENQKIEIHF
jgi:hypothetical protein